MKRSVRDLKWLKSFVELISFGLTLFIKVIFFYNFRDFFLGFREVLLPLDPFEGFNNTLVSTHYIRIDSSDSFFSYSFQKESSALILRNPFLDFDNTGYCLFSSLLILSEILFQAFFFDGILSNLENRIYKFLYEFKGSIKSFCKEGNKVFPYCFKVVLSA